MNKFYSFFLVALVLFCLSGCSNSTKAYESINYGGRNLVIGVVGKPPEIKEENIKFERLSFSDLTNLNKMPLDAVFITKENLEEASQPQFSEVYKNSPIPFVFIESQKLTLPFLVEDLSYEEAPDIFNPYFAILYYNNFDAESGKSDYTESFGLYNNEVTEEHIKETYSLLFSSIENISNK